MRTVLGVDGGNSKTDVVIVDESGRLLARVRGAGCSPDALGVVGALDVLRPLITTARADAGVDDASLFDAASFLLAGVDRPEQEDQMASALVPLGLARQLAVTNDTFAVLLAGSSHGHGIAVVCGAGLNAVGVAPDGTIGRYQALGTLSGDWGGGYEVGLAGLGAAIRGADGRGPATVLTAELSAHFEVSTPQEAAAAIHEGRLDSQVLVDLAPIVFAASIRGDAVSNAIVDRVADEVAAMAIAMMRRLNLQEAATEIILGGGLLQAGNSRLIDRIKRLAMDADPSLVVRVLDVPPVVGAVRSALAQLSLAETDISVALKSLATQLS